MDGFSVDLDALTSASTGISELVSMLEQQDVRDIDCDRSAVGHPDLADKLESFCDRWQIGVANLAKDGNEVARRLAESVADYQATDEAVAQGLGGPATDG